MHLATKETSFCFTYGVDAVIPKEIGELSPRVLLSSKIGNDTNRSQELYLLPELLEKS